MSEAQRKRRTTGSPLVARSSTKTSRRVSARRAANDTSIIVREVVDLTCEGSECAVVDLTSNDSVLRSTVTTAESYVVSSDEDDNAAPVLKTSVVSLHDNSVFRPTPGTISCPVCLDSYCEIVDSGRLVVSTKCGHVFCSQCLRDALTSSHTCPTCRKRLTHRQYHPLYI
uniref:Ring finger protein 4 n=1 Tax=Takifugu rubripes TaxID=31033 RepID=A0A674P8G2_TAKRU